MIQVVFSSIDMSNVITVDEEELLFSTKQLIPKVIHQVYIGNYLGDEEKVTKKSMRWLWKRYYEGRGWKLKLWKSTDIEELISSEYPWLLSLYEGYMFNTQRADIARYLLVYHYGGVYVDLDAGPAYDFDLSRLLRVGLVVTLKTDGLLLNNHFFMAMPRSPFLWELLKLCVDSNVLFVLPYLQVFYSTGPMLFTRAFKHTFASNSRKYLKEDKAFVTDTTTVTLRSHTSQYNTSHSSLINNFTSNSPCTSRNTFDIKNSNDTAISGLHESPPCDKSEFERILVLTAEQGGMYVTHKEGRTWQWVDGNFFNWLVDAGVFNWFLIGILAISTSISCGYLAVCLRRFPGRLSSTNGHSD